MALAGQLPGTGPWGGRWLGGCGYACGSLPRDTVPSRFYRCCLVSPRACEREGEAKAHIARLAEAETPLPPVLVDRRSMRVIDGMHRLMAALSKGRETIDVQFFEALPRTRSCVLSKRT